MKIDILFANPIKKIYNHNKNYLENFDNNYNYRAKSGIFKITKNKMNFYMNLYVFNK